MVKDTKEYYVEYLRRKWYIKRDKSKMAPLVECDPTQLSEQPWKHKTPRIYRFTSSTSDIFGQYDPVVVLRGSQNVLLGLEASALIKRDAIRSSTVEKEPCGNRGCRLCPADLGHDTLTDHCIAVTYEQLAVLIEHCKRKRYTDAFDMMCAAGLPTTDHRGQRIVVDKLLPMVRAHWLKGGLYMLVCVQLHTSEVHLKMISGLRDPALTSANNVDRGGEDVREAAVRVAREQGFEIEQADLIHIEGQRKKFQRRDCLEFFRIEVSN